MYASFLVALCSFAFSLNQSHACSCKCNQSNREIVMQEEMTPKYLYKILSAQNWEASQEKDSLVLASGDDGFIHLAKEDQLERILGKYWNAVSEYYILTIDTEKLVGNLVYETNPGGSAKYYHLYEGSIPLESVVESKFIEQATSN